MLLLEVIGMDHAAQVESALVMDVTRELAVVPSFAVPMVVASGAPLMDVPRVLFMNLMVPSFAVLMVVASSAPLMDVASQFALVAFAMFMVVPAVHR